MPTTHNFLAFFDKKLLTRYVDVSENRYTKEGTVNGTNHIQPAELERLLREFGGPLADINVKPSQIIAPWIVSITGAAKVHGKPFYFETDFNLREIGGPEEIIGLARLLLRAFEKADRGIPQ